MSLIVGSTVVEWVAKKTHEYGNFGSAQGIGWMRDGKMIAGVVYADWNGPNVVCHIASDGSRRWLNREYLWTIFDYPFNQLKCRRITICVGEGNKDSRKFVEHLGFEKEAQLENAHPTGDLLVYRIKKEECKWIFQDFSRRHAKAA